MTRAALGMIHGRFQPFHLGHLAYMREAAARCERLLVGITNPDRLRTRAVDEDASRHLPESNPFTYTDRLRMVLAAAEEAGVAPVLVIPFPITEPELWPDYVPPGTVHYLRVLSPWGAAKLDRLRAGGGRVEALDAGAGKTVSGTKVREAMRGGGDWASLVPASVADVIRTLPLAGAPAPRPPA